MKITVCNNYISEGEWVDYGKRTSKMMDDYALSNDYSRSCITHRLSNTKWMGWDKIKLCMDLLPTCDALFCLDTDLMIMNHNITVQSYLDDFNEIYIPRDHDNINVGVIILKNTSYVNSFLNDVWRQRLDLPDEFQSEQIAWWNSMKIFNFHRMKIIPQKSINSYPYWDEVFVKRFGPVESEKSYFSKQYDPVVQRCFGSYTTGDMIMHMPGIPMKRRYEYLNQYENKVIKKY